MAADRERLQAADTARRKWEEATAAKADAAEQARAELDWRGPARPDEHRAQADVAEAREVHAADVEAQQEAHAETSAEIDAPEAAQQVSHAEPEADAAIGQQSGELAGIDPQALDTVASIQRNLADAEQRAEKKARDWAAIEQAGIDEPVNHAEHQAELDATAKPRPTRTRTSKSEPSTEVEQYSSMRPAELPGLTSAGT